MIEDNVVLFAPAEGAEMVQILVVEEALGNRPSGFIDGAVNEFRGQEDAERWKLGQLVQDRLADLRRKTLAYRVNEACYPFIVLGAIDRLAT